MKKIRLELDDLAIVSFSTTPPVRKAGTVVGHLSQHQLCTGGADYSCPCEPNYYYTENQSCGDVTCIDSCAYTCDPCDVSVNEVGSCIQAQSCGYANPCM